MKSDESSSILEIRRTIDFDKKVFSIDKIRVYYLRKQEVYDDNEKNFEVLEVFYVNGSKGYTNIRYSMENDNLFSDSELKLKKNLASVIVKE
ncbi:MAG: hypothetical protein JW791_04870, partial [Nanoarchaeota archaeon]|nr:hypothetical protein [Nanoarchaeota archaeon]